MIKACCREIDFSSSVYFIQELFFFQFAKRWTESNGLESKSLTPVLCRASANKLKIKENVYTPKSAVKDDNCFVFPEPKTPVNKNQYKREILSTPNHDTTPSKGICYGD